MSDRKRDLLFFVISVLVHLLVGFFIAQLPHKMPQQNLELQDVCLEEKLPDFVFKPIRKAAQVEASKVKGISGKKTVGSSGSKNYSSSIDKGFATSGKFKLVIESEKQFNFKLHYSKPVGIIKESLITNPFKEAILIGGLKNYSDANWEPQSVKEYISLGGRVEVRENSGNYKLWYKRVCRKIADSWHISTFKKTESGEAVCGIRFLVDGRGSISDLKVLRLHEVEVFNELALKAIKKGAPYPPLPDGMENVELYVEFGYDD